MKRKIHFLLALMLACTVTACGTPAADSQSETPVNAAAGDAGTPVIEDGDRTDTDDGNADETQPGDSAAEPQPEAGTEPAELPEKAPDAVPDPPAAPEGSAPAAPAAEASAPVSAPAAPAEEAPKAPEPSGVSLTEIRDKMLSDLGISDYMEVSASRLFDLYGIPEADLVQSASFATMSGVFPGEVVLVEAADADAAARIAGLLQNRLDEVLNQYKTYDAETYALAEACTIDTDGTVVSMLLSPQRAEMRQILTDSLG